jgi:hypothetical protein
MMYLIYVMVLLTLTVHAGQVAAYATTRRR